MAETAARVPPGRTRPLRFLEASIVVPLLVWLAFEFQLGPNEFLDWRILVWVLAIAAVDLLPLEGEGDLAFSLSFPIELSAALVYSPPVAALIALLGAADKRELRRELPPLKALYIRGQIALSVAVESQMFHQLASLDESPWFVLAAAVLAASISGYIVNVLIVALY